MAGPLKQSVRPPTMMLKGLGQDDSDDVFITADGNILPKNARDREAEVARIEQDERMAFAVAEEEMGSDGLVGGRPPPHVGGGCAEDLPVEGSYVKARLAPKEPTAAERLRHEATHIPYRAWCQQCVRGRGRCKPHFRRTDPQPENAIPKITMDYFFLGSEDTAAEDNPMFVLADEENGHRYARMVESKGLGDDGDNHWPVLDAAREIRSWGHPEGSPIILKCDGEGAIRNVRDALGRYLGHTTPVFMSMYILACCNPKKTLIKTV